MENKSYQILNFKCFGDYRGNLVPIEQGTDCPFKIERIYYIFGSDSDVIRGKHAHKDLQQMIICLHGSCNFILDDGKIRETIKLDSPTKALYITGEKMLWREFSNFNNDCVVMVLASKHYSENDYIKDYEEFKKLVS